MARNDSPKAARGPSDKEPSSDRADKLLTIVLLALLAVVCIIAWWLARRRAVPGAPGAPLGMELSANSRPSGAWWAAFQEDWPTCSRM
jgi:hypothetical protein